MTIQPVGPPRINISQEGQFVSRPTTFASLVRFVIIGVAILGGLKLLSILF